MGYYHSTCNMQYYLLYRYGTATFTSKVDMVVHGIAGYFESTLFQPATTSTVVADSTTSNVPSDYIDTTPATACTLNNTNSNTIESPAVKAPAQTPVGAPGLQKLCANIPSSTFSPFPPPPLPPPPRSTSSTTSTVANENDSVMLSIVPQSHTPGMCSWFPLFIPLKQPIRVLAGQAITIHIWRLVKSSEGNLQHTNAVCNHSYFVVVFTFTF